MAEQAVPLVRHYQQAERETKAWYPGEPVPQSRVEMHVLSQVSSHTYAQLDQMTMREYEPLLTELVLNTTPVPMKVLGAAPWTLVRCDCCTTCRILCTCGAACSCGALDEGEGYANPERITFRSFLTEDLHKVAGNGLVNWYDLVALLTKRPIGEMEYRVFNVVAQAIQRSYSSPFPPWAASPP